MAERKKPALKSQSKPPLLPPFLSRSSSYSSSSSSSSSFSSSSSSSSSVSLTSGKFVGRLKREVDTGRSPEVAEDAQDDPSLPLPTVKKRTVAAAFPTVAFKTEEGVGLKKLKTASTSSLLRENHLEDPNKAQFDGEEETEGKEGKKGKEGKEGSKRREGERGKEGKEKAEKKDARTKREEEVEGEREQVEHHQEDKKGKSRQKEEEKRKEDGKRTKFKEEKDRSEERERRSRPKVKEEEEEEEKEEKEEKKTDKLRQKEKDQHIRKQSTWTLGSFSREATGGVKGEMRQLSFVPNRPLYKPPILKAAARVGVGKKAVAKSVAKTKEEEEAEERAREDEEEEDRAVYEMMQASTVLSSIPAHSHSDSSQSTHNQLKSDTHAEPFMRLASKFADVLKKIFQILNECGLTNINIKLIPTSYITPKHAKPIFWIHYFKDGFGVEVELLKDFWREWHVKEIDAATTPMIGHLLKDIIDIKEPKDYKWIKIEFWPGQRHVMWTYSDAYDGKDYTRRNLKAVNVEETEEYDPPYDNVIFIPAKEFERVCSELSKNQYIQIKFDERDLTFSGVADRCGASHSFRITHRVFSKPTDIPLDKWDPQKIMKHHESENSTVIGIWKERTGSPQDPSFSPRSIPFLTSTLRKISAGAKIAPFLQLLLPANGVACFIYRLATSRHGWVKFFVCPARPDAVLALSSEPDNPPPLAIAPPETDPS